MENAPKLSPEIKEEFKNALIADKGADYYNNLVNLLRTKLLEIKSSSKIRFTKEEFRIAIVKRVIQENRGKPTLNEQIVLTEIALDSLL